MRRTCVIRTKPGMNSGDEGFIGSVPPFLAAVRLSVEFWLQDLLSIRLGWPAQRPRTRCHIAPHPCRFCDRNVDVHGGVDTLDETVVIRLEAVGPAICFQERRIRNVTHHTFETTDRLHQHRAALRMFFKYFFLVSEIVIGQIHESENPTPWIAASCLSTKHLIRPAVRQTPRLREC